MQHVSLLQGTKAYGVHHPASTARMYLSRCGSGRGPNTNFYWLQEDDLGAAAHPAWALTIFRPTVVYGAMGLVNMNPLPAIAVYAALQRAPDEPLHFPGTETANRPRGGRRRHRGPALPWGGDVAATPPGARST